MCKIDKYINMKLTAIFIILFSFLIFFTSITLANENDDKKGKKPNRYNLLIKSRQNFYSRHHLANRPKY